MTIEQREIVLGDTEGNYYALPHEVIEGYRVSAEQKAELVKRIGDRGDDVGGYMLDPNPSPPPAPPGPPGGSTSGRGGPHPPRIGFFLV